MNNELNLNAFKGCINAFYSSRLILIDNPISSILKTLVGRTDYFQIIGECAKASLFSTEYKKAISVGVDGKKFYLPDSDSRIVSLVTGLLFEFDKNNISVIDFVTSYFPAKKPHESYIQFCDNVIRPYEKSFNNLYLGIVSNEEATEVTDNTKMAPLIDKAKEDCDYWLRTMLDTIIGDNSITERLRADSIKMINGLLYVLEMNSPMLVNIVWTGLDRTLSNVASCYRELRELELILRNYGAIE